MRAITVDLYAPMSVLLRTLSFSKYDQISLMTLCHLISDALLINDGQLNFAEKILHRVSH